MFPDEFVNGIYRQVIDLLIEYGADIESRTMSGQTPLLYAANNLSSEALTYMAEQGADLAA